MRTTNISIVKSIGYRKIGGLMQRTVIIIKVLACYGKSGGRVKGWINCLPKLFGICFITI